MTKAKKIFLVVISIMFVAVVGIGTYLLIKGNKNNEVLDKTGVNNLVIEAVKKIDAASNAVIAGNNNASSGAVASSSENGTLGNIYSNNLELSEVYENTIANIGRGCALLQPLLINDALNLKNPAFGWVSNDYTLYVDVKSETNIVKSTVLLDFTTRTETFFMTINHNEGELEKINLISVGTEDIERYPDLKYYNYTSYNIENNTFQNVQFYLIGKTYDQLVADYKNNAINDDYLNNYIRRTETSNEITYNYIEANEKNVNLSNHEGWRVVNVKEGETDTFANALNSHQKQCFNLALRDLTQSFASEAEMLLNIDKTKAVRSFLMEEAYNYSASKFAIMPTLDEFGNTKLSPVFVKYNDLKSQISQINAIANNKKPFYGDVNYPALTAKGNATGEHSFDEEGGKVVIEFSLFKGLVDAVSNVINDKTSNNFWGLTNTTYGNYKFTLVNGSLIGNEYSENSTRSMIQRELVEDKLVKNFNDRVLCNTIYAKYTGLSSTAIDDYNPFKSDAYLRLDFSTNANGTIDYMMFRAIGGEGNLFSFVVEYANAGTGENIHQAFLAQELNLYEGNNFIGESNYVIGNSNVEAEAFERVEYYKGFSKYVNSERDEYDDTYILTGTKGYEVEKYVVLPKDTAIEDGVNYQTYSIDASNLLEYYFDYPYDTHFVVEILRNILINPESN